MNPLGTIVITGGARGIGAEAVRLSAQAGHDVLFTYASRPDRAAQVVSDCEPFGVTVTAMQADVRDPSLSKTVIAAAAEISPVVGLVNNAGITSSIGSFLDVEVDAMKEVLDVNVILCDWHCHAGFWRSVRG